MPSRRSAMAGLFAAAVGAACRSVPDRKPYQPTLDQLAERYIRLTLRLARHQPSLVEAWRGPEDWIPPLREPVEGIRQGIVEAHSAAGDLRAAADDDRLRYLQGQFAALAIAARRLAGESMAFFAEASASLGLEPRDLRADQRAIADAREELDERLPGTGPLPERHAAFRRRTAIPRPRVLPAFRAAVDACQARVAQRIVLPATESVEVQEESGLGVEAQATYNGGFRTRIALDTSGPIDVAHLVWLAAHEAYPGHHVQHVLADRDCIREHGWRERELYPAFGPHYLYAEGSAEAGAALLLEGDSFEGMCRELARSARVSPASVADSVAVHRAVTTLDAVVPSIAQAYLDGDIGGDAARERLTEEALVADAAGFLSVIERRRTRLLGYPVGRQLVTAVLAGAPGDERWRRLTAIATTLVLPPR